MATLASLGFTRLQAAQEIWALWSQEFKAVTASPHTEADIDAAWDKISGIAKGEGFDDLWDVDFEISCSE